MNPKSNPHHQQNDHHSPSCRLVTITPEMASELLAINSGNRNISLPHVEYLARQMARGHWRLNGETIIVSNGRLLDGQHRLLACISSNTPFDTFIVEGVASRVFDTIDTGKRRSASDVLQIDGRENAVILAGAAGFVKRMWHGQWSAIYSPSEIANAVRLFMPQIGESVEFCRQYFGGKLLPPSIMVACHYAFTIASNDRQSTDEFFQKLCDGLGLERTEPVWHLRQRLIASAKSRSRTRLDRKFTAALVVKAWNATRDGSPMKVLRLFEGEPFPKIHK